MISDAQLFRLIHTIGLVQGKLTHLWKMVVAGSFLTIIATHSVLISLQIYARHSKNFVLLGFAQETSLGVLRIGSVLVLYIFACTILLVGPLITFLCDRIFKAIKVSVEVRTDIANLIGAFLRSFCTFIFLFTIDGIAWFPHWITIIHLIHLIVGLFVLWCDYYWTHMCGGLGKEN